MDGSFKTVATQGTCHDITLGAVYSTEDWPAELFLKLSIFMLTRTSNITAGYGVQFLPNMYGRSKIPKIWDFGGVNSQCPHYGHFMVINQ